jgi:hypothetical protein
MSMSGVVHGEPRMTRAKPLGGLLKTQSDKQVATSD